MLPFVMYDSEATFKLLHAYASPSNLLQHLRRLFTLYLPKQVLISTGIQNSLSWEFHLPMTSQVWPKKMMWTW